MGKKAKVFKPGDYVFAKVKGYPAWPAKISRSNGKKYNIYFYGTGETGNVLPNDIFDYFEHKQQFLSKALKRRDYNEGLAQIDYEITEAGIANNDYERPEAGLDALEIDESQLNATAEEPSVANDNDDTINASASENDLSTPSVVPETPVKPVAKVPRKRGAAAAAATVESPNATPAKVRKVAVETPTEAPKETSEEMETNGEESAAAAQPVSNEDEAAAAEEVAQPEAEQTETPSEKTNSTPVPTKTLGVRVRKLPNKVTQNTPKTTPRRSVKLEVTSPTYEPHVPAPTTPASESVSRSGRKIKPKKQFDDEAAENVQTPAKKIKIQPTTPPTAVSAASDSESAKEVETANSVVNDTPVVSEAPKRGRKKLVKNSVTKNLNFISASELTALEEPPATEQEGALKEYLLPILLPSGKLVGMKLFKDWPESMGSKDAQKQWMKTTATNSIRLKNELENGRLKPETILNQLEMDLQLTPEEITQLKTDQENEIRKRIVALLKTECRLLEMEKSIRDKLNFDSADMPEVNQILDELKDLNVTRLMLLKQPGLVQVIKSLRHYEGNLEHWKLSEEEAEKFIRDRDVGQQKALACFDKFKKILDVDEDSKFAEKYKQLRAMFVIYVDNLSEKDVAALVDEPVEFSQPNALSASIVTEELEKEKNTHMNNSVPKESKTKAIDQSESTKENAVESN